MESNHRGLTLHFFVIVRFDKSLQLIVLVEGLVERFGRLAVLVLLAVVLASIAAFLFAPVVELVIAVVLPSVADCVHFEHPVALFLIDLVFAAVDLAVS